MEMNYQNAEQMMLRGPGTVPELNSNSSPSTNKEYGSPQQPPDGTGNEELVVMRRRGDNV